MKTGSRFNLAKGARSRDASHSDAPDHVADDAQANLIDKNTWRKFDFAQQQGQLPDRPSTSAGPSSRLPRRKDAEKRETKDDLHFNPLAVHGKGTTFYNFPLPGSIPTPHPPHPPQPPQKSAPPPPRKSSIPVPKSSAPKPLEPAPPEMSVQPMEIGMALGSPTHQPTDWQTQTRFERIARTESPDMMDDSIDGIVAPVKPKASKWKILGGIFGGRKHSASQETPFYQLQPETTHKTEVTAGEPSNLEEPTSSEARPKSRGRGRTLSERKTKKNKPDVKRSNTAPLHFDLQETEQYIATNPEITLDGGPLLGNSVKPEQFGKSYHGQMLDVDIPSIQMERYSIMFGSVLQKTTATSSSLLARRQATLDKLKTVNEALASKEQELHARERMLRPRRATSPQPTKSPAFSLFPNTPSRLTVRDPSPSGTRSGTLQRSNTSPAALSPSRPSFAPGPENEAHTILISQPTNLTGPPNPQYKGPSVIKKTQKNEESKPATKPSSTSSPQDQSRNWSPDHSQLILDSPVSDGEAELEDIYDTSPLPIRSNSTKSIPMKPKLTEPSWQMVNAPHGQLPPPPKSSSSVSGSDHSASGSTSSTSASSISESPITHSAKSSHKAIIMNTPPAAKTRQRSATTTAMHQRHNLSEISEVSSTKSPKETSANDEDENEARLKSAADVSIARQISVSRQQRQLLIPIRAKTPSNNNLNMKYSQSSPNAMSAHLGVNRVASPLGAIAVATKEERQREANGKDRAGSPLIEKREKGEKVERLVEGVKPSTPTLVVVPGPEKNEMLKAWGGAMAVHSTPVGLAERRKGKTNASTMGEIKVGLAVSRAGSSHAHFHHNDLPNRKSEQVVVERVSIDVN